MTGTLPDRLEALPGSSAVVSRQQLGAERPYSVREALQGVPGLHVVGEDAFALNLNIGIRGLDPRRTSRTLLLEDGMPIHLAPYSDPTARYHTLLERLQRMGRRCPRRRQLDAIVEAKVEDGEAEKERDELRSTRWARTAAALSRAAPRALTTACITASSSSLPCAATRCARASTSLTASSRVSNWSTTPSGLRSELVTGMRLHHEKINRKRYNGATPTARENSPGTGLRDEFGIETDAVAAYVQSTVYAGNWSVTPGLRYENYRQKNRITQGEFAPVVPGVTSSQRNSELLPGLGVTWFGLPNTMLFAGIHRGIAPPRPDANLPPGDEELEKVGPELSTNIELGLSSKPVRGVQVEATLFEIDFKNQILPGYAVGEGQTFANAGRSTNRGLELASRIGFGRLQGRANNVYLAASYTDLFTAKLDSDLLTPDFGDEDETETFTNAPGNRLPYAPRHLLSASLGFEYGSRWDARIGLMHVSEQYTDALNTREPAADGQSDRIPSFTTFNASVNYRLPEQGVTLYLSAANLFDKTYLVSRVNGAFAGAPRQVFAGGRISF